MTVNKTQGREYHAEPLCIKYTQRNIKVLTEYITQTASLPNVHIVGAHGAGSCSVLPLLSPAHLLIYPLVSGRSKTVSGSVTSPAVEAPVSGGRSTICALVRISSCQHRMLLNCQTLLVGLAFDSSGASGAGRKISCTDSYLPSGQGGCEVLCLTFAIRLVA